MSKNEGVIVRVDIPLYMHQSLKQFKEYSSESNAIKIWSTSERDMFKADKTWLEAHKKLIAAAKVVSGIEQSLLDERAVKASKTIIDESKR